MFGPGFGKLLVLVLVIAVVWYGFKHFTRANQVRETLRRDRAPAGPTGAAGPARSVDAEDMQKCAACGTYVPSKGARSCGRGDCPYPG